MFIKQLILTRSAKAQLILPQVACNQIIREQRRLASFQKSSFASVWGTCPVPASDQHCSHTYRWGTCHFVLSIGEMTKKIEGKDQSMEKDLVTHLMRFDFLRQQKIDATHWMSHIRSKESIKNSLQYYLLEDVQMKQYINQLQQSLYSKLRKVRGMVTKNTL